MFERSCSGGRRVSGHFRLKKKKEVKKKGLSSSKKDQLLYKVADNKRRRKEELFPSLLLHLRVSL